MAGGTSGHVSLGLAFLTIGLWHLFNTTKHHLLHPKSYQTQPWFPVPRLRYLEPVIVMLVTSIFVLMELVVGRSPVLPDGSIPSNMLRHFEHSIIAVSFFVYALFAVLLDKMAQAGHVRHGLAHFLQAVAFGQQLLILHLHSTDHMGIEGQYHWLLQIVTFASLAATLLVIRYPTSFVVSFVRNFFVVFTGFWMIFIGVVLWTPRWMPKGCYLRSEGGRDAVLCHGDRALERAKALVNIQFGWYLSMLTVFVMSFYLVMIKIYPQEKIEYESLSSKCDHDHQQNYKGGAQENITKLCLPGSSVPV